jgi:hypothetical protein
MATLDINVYFEDVIKAAATLDAAKDAAETAAEDAAKAAEAAKAAAGLKPAGHMFTASGAMRLIETAILAVKAEASAAEAAATKATYVEAQEQVANLLVVATKTASAAVKTQYEKEGSYW